MNAEALRATAKRLRELPDERLYDQSAWGYGGRARMDCGTACCIAGHAVLADGGALSPMTEADGAKVLGLTPTQSLVLFDGGAARWPQPFCDRYYEAVFGDYEGKVSGESPSHVAADLLEALADGTVTL